ncbi:MAG: hypothetical protein HQK97_08785 [Nitrospirae bacterium]|nr:hypothetical protein [Nitrospirota bacterium]
MLLITLIFSIVTAVWTKNRTIRKIHKNAIEYLNTYNNYLLDKMKAYISYPKILSHRPHVIEELRHPGQQLNEYLAQFNQDIGLSIVFIMNKNGVVVASSNYKDSSSFVGKNFSFREYFQNAMKGMPSDQISFGILTRIVGFFRSHPVMDGDEVIGVVVIKYDIQYDMDQIAPKNTGEHMILMVADDYEVVFHASDKKFLFHTIHKLPEDTLKTIKESKRYADEPLPSLPIVKESEEDGLKFVTIRHSEQSEIQNTGTDYLMVGTSGKTIGWNVHLLVELSGVRYEIYKNVVFVLLSMILIYSVGAFTIFRIKKGHELNQYRQHLEELVKERTSALTQANEQLRDEINKRKALLSELETAYDDLKKSQDHLIQSEKMAALGGLVAGVAHEINTPIGIGITGASHFNEITKAVAASVNDGTITRTKMDEYIADAADISALILKNLIRTGELIKSFKMVAADQLREQRRQFNIKQYLNDIILSLQPRLKRTSHAIKINCEESSALDSYPGAFAQVITNLIMNSLVHAYDTGQQGNITIDVTKTDDSVTITYKDDGKGIGAENIKKIFDPFFTTNRGGGGTGLGLNICYNVVTQTLKGTIVCESVEGEGVAFILNVPCAAKETAA